MVGEYSCKLLFLKSFLPWTRYLSQRWQKWSFFNHLSFKLKNKSNRKPTCCLSTKRLWCCKETSGKVIRKWWFVLQVLRFCFYACKILNRLVMFLLQWWDLGQEWYTFQFSYSLLLIFFIKLCVTCGCQTRFPASLTTDNPSFFLILQGLEMCLPVLWW